MKREHRGQNHRKKRQLCGDGGFSLAELIVAMAVMTIVGGGIAAIVVSSIRQYQNQSAEVNVQFEAQTAQNRIQDLVIDARNGVSLEVGGVVPTGTPDANGKTTTTVAEAASGSTDSVTLHVYDYEDVIDNNGNPVRNKLRIDISFNRNKHWLEYERFIWNGIGWDSTSDKECFAAYIEDFKVTAVEEKTSELVAGGTSASGAAITAGQPGSIAVVENTLLKTLKIEVDYKTDARTYKSCNVINLRNPVILSGDVGKLYRN